VVCVIVLYLMVLVENPTKTHLVCRKSHKMATDDSRSYIRKRSQRLLHSKVRIHLISDVERKQDPFETSQGLDNNWIVPYNFLRLAFCELPLSCKTIRAMPLFALRNLLLSMYRKTVTLMVIVENDHIAELVVRPT
jgi:hypothetical protein